MADLPTQELVSPVRPGRVRLWIALASAVVFLVGLGSRDLWNPDEPRYAEVAREMLATNQFFVPHLNGEMYTQKPPLHFWSIALVGGIRGGVDEVAARLPSALAAIGTVLLTFQLGLTLFGRRAAWMAAVILGTAFKILWQGRIGQIDMQLVFWVSLAMFFWVRGYLEERRGFYWLFFAATGFATLAKGPVGLLPPLLSITVFLLLRREGAVLKQMRIPLGLLLWAAVVFLWLVPAGLVGGREYLEQIVFKQNVTRFVNPWHHFRPFYYYLTIIPGDFFPWSFLLPGALVVGWRRLRGESRRGFLLALCWMVVTLIFFSVSPAKRTVYILTMYPAMALLVAAFVDHLAAHWPRDRGWLLIPLALQGLLLAVAIPFVPGQVERHQELADLFAPSLPAFVMLLLGVFAVGAVGAFFVSWRGRPSRAPLVLATAAAIAAVMASVWILPQFDVIKSARELSQVLSDRMAPGETYAIYPRIDPQFIFYTERFAELPADEQELQSYARRPDRVWLLIEKNAFGQLEESLPMTEVARDQDAEGGYLLLASDGTEPPGI